MEKNISVIGVGKLGLCFALVLEKIGFRVLGVDLDDGYIENLNNKTFNSNEPEVNEYLNQSRNFSATTDINKAIVHSDILFLFVSTPSLKDGRYDHSQIDRVLEQLAKNFKVSQKKHLIIGCTTMPGYCDYIQEKMSEYGYRISYNPEFIAQGSVIKDMTNPDIVLIGEADISAGNEIENIYLSIAKNQPTIYRMNRKEAEITKIAINCFITTKIAYANMVGDIAKSAECDPAVILNAIGSDKRIGNKNLNYGYGFGGPCFPRDNRAFALFADDMDINAVISKASDKANKMHLDYQVNDFKKKYNKNDQIIFSNVSYKIGTEIIEESQKLLMAVKLAEMGYNITIKDARSIIKKIKKVYNDLFSYISCE